MAKKESIVILPYDDHWPDIFALEKEKIQNVLGTNVHIEHIGSTSVPNLCAKPIIDIMIGICSIGMAKKYIKDLEKLNYSYFPDYEALIPERRYLEKKGFHVHMVEKNGDFWKRHVFFRDFLRAHADIAREYCEIKKKLARKYKNEREKYTEAKGPFIQKVLKNMYEKEKSNKKNRKAEISPPQKK